MEFVCIDFETANRFNGSACAVGVAHFGGGKIIESKHWYIKPQKEHRFFDYFYTSIHGMTEAHKGALVAEHFREKTKRYQGKRGALHT